MTGGALALAPAPTPLAPPPPAGSGVWPMLSSGRCLTSQQRGAAAGVARGMCLRHGLAPHDCICALYTAAPLLLFLSTLNLCQAVVYTCSNNIMPQNICWHAQNISLHARYFTSTVQVGMIARADAWADIKSCGSMLLQVDGMGAWNSSNRGWHQRSTVSCCMAAWKAWMH